MKRPAPANHGPKGGAKIAKDPRPAPGTNSAVTRVMTRGVRRKSVLDEK